MDTQSAATWPQHDVDRWGTRWLDDARSRGVRRLADIARLRRSETRSTRRAAFEVVCELDAKLASIDRVYFVRPHGEPAALADTDVWSPPSLHPDDAATDRGSWRHMSTAGGGDPWSEFDRPSFELEDDDGFSLVERGRSGLMQCLWAWVMSVDVESDLDRGIAATLAVDDAFAASLASGGAGLRVVVAGGAAAPDLPSGPELQAELEALVRAGKRSTVGSLATKYGVNRSTIQRRLKGANGAIAKAASQLIQAGKRAQR